ncbi:MAG TPA: IucA/IucC family protein [Micromonosporaceae bacterium]|nr:IucA/IucC family protein [Micromonosporaceae bacterium]
MSDEAAHLAGARAAVLGRLWGALAREPIPGLRTRMIDGEDLVIALADGRRLRAPHSYSQPFVAPPAGFAVELDGVRYDDPAHLLRAVRPPQHWDRLAEELDNSVANLALARAAQPPPDGGEPALARAIRTADPLAYLEQCVVDGHPLHPGCRTRIGLSPDEIRAYAPEHRPVVGLHIVDVPPERWWGHNCPPQLPVHPWQRDHVLGEYPFLRPTGEVWPARPLMSLRTLSRDPEHHVKTAVDVQMTSARRIVSPAAVHNGPILSRLMLELAARIPGLGVLPEPSAGTVLVDGEPCRSLAVVHRRMPPLAAGEVALPLAVLSAPSPADGGPIAREVVAQGYGKDASAFVGALAALALPPLLELLRLGIALEAHGQNLLAVFRDGRLTRLLYRDFGGVRVSPRRLRRHGIPVPKLRGDLVTDDPHTLRTKLVAAVFTALAEPIAALARWGELDPEEGWSRVAAVCRVYATDAGPTSDAGPDAAFLLADTVPVKATTAMRLAADPLQDQWAWLPNPMAGVQ